MPLARRLARPGGRGAQPGSADKAARGQANPRHITVTNCVGPTRLRRAGAAPDSPQITLKCVIRGPPNKGTGGPGGSRTTLHFVSLHIMLVSVKCFSHSLRKSMNASIDRNSLVHCGFHAVRFITENNLFHFFISGIF